MDSLLSAVKAAGRFVTPSWLLSSRPAGPAKKEISDDKGGRCQTAPGNGIADEFQQYSCDPVSFASGQYEPPRYSGIFGEGQPRTPGVRESDYEPNRSRRTVRFGDSRPAKKTMSVETFSGKTELSDYMAHFERVAAWNQWSYDEKGEQLAMSLRGPALQVLGYLEREEGDDYETLKAALFRRFSPEERVTSYRCEFRNRKWQKGESVSEYGFALSRLAAKAYCDIPPDSREVMMIEQFISGLGSLDLQRHVQFGHPSTLDQAVSLAGEYVSFRGVAADRYLKPTGGGEGGMHVRSIGRDGQSDRHREEGRDAVMSSIKELQKQMKLLMDKDRGGEQRERKAKGACYTCGSEKHWARQCPQKSEDRNDRRNGERGTTEVQRGPAGEKMAGNKELN